MSIMQMMLGAGGGGDYISYSADEVFAITTYAGNNTTNVITNGIDLAGEGGLMLFKSYDAPYNTSWIWCDTEDKVHATGTVTGHRKLAASKGTGYYGNYTAYPTYAVKSLQSTGFTLGLSMIDENRSGTDIVNYTFRKAENFFDIVTYTGNSSEQSVPHNLGRTPGMVIYKATGPASSNKSYWGVWHNSGHASGIGSEADPPYAYFNFEDSSGALANIWFAAANTGSSPWDESPPDADNLYLGWNAGIVTDQQWNESGEEYVAYIFDTDTNIIKCGSYQGTYSGNATVTGLGFQPGFLMIKAVNELTDWFIWDSVRDTTGDNTKPLVLNDEDNELDSTNYAVSFDSNGFTVKGREEGSWSGEGINYSTSKHYIYMAIADPT